MEFVPANMSDAKDIWLWRNDDDSRKFSIDSSLIEWDQHLQWFERSLKNSNRKIYMVISQGQRIGSIRSDAHGEEVELSWMLNPAFRGQGLGKAMLKNFCESVSYPAVSAVIKKDNRASEKIAEAAGFVKIIENEEYSIWQRRRSEFLENTKI